MNTVNGNQYRLANQVWRVGYGAMQLAGDSVFGPPRARDAAVAVLRAAVDAVSITSTPPGTTVPPSLYPYQIAEQHPTRERIVWRQSDRLAPPQRGTGGSDALRLRLT
jgi:hypothetical protein